MLFFRYLIKKLNNENLNWWNNTIILLDGARYHTSEDMREYLRKLEISVIFSGPYSYSAAPIERLFSALKDGDINPEKLPTGKR